MAQNLEEQGDLSGAPGRSATRQPCDTFLKTMKTPVLEDLQLEKRRVDAGNAAPA